MNEQTTHNRKKAQLLKKAWDVDADHVRYRENGTWYHPLERFPAALFDRTGYIRFPTKEALPAEHICPGGDYTFPNGISALLGYVRRAASDVSPAPKEIQQPPVDLPEPPVRFETQVSRIIRDTKRARELKSLYGFACQVCGLRIEPTGDSFYVEAHHVRPLGGGHDGPDTHSNMLVLCPNHHAMFDFGIPRFLSPGRIEIAGTAYDLTVKHALSPKSIAYHNTKLRSHNAS